MIYLALPDNKVRRLSFYLAMEEYVARHMDDGDYFFMWQVEPSVIFGRNQLIESEVNLDFCRKHNIQTYRRKSGGGCVYADMNNVMFSYITCDDQVNFTFNRYVNMVVLALQRLGIDASPSGRNDVMIGNKKVSGNAFYKVSGHSIVHGTMLYDTDMLNMAGVITPPETKLISHGIKSIHQRVDFLKNYLTISIEEFKEFIHKQLCREDRMLNAEDIRQIEEIEQEYLSDEFIYGKNPRYTIVKKRRIEGVGEFEARIELKNNTIKSVNLMGDFFLIGDLDKGLLNKLKNVPLEAGAIHRILPDRIDDIIMNLMKTDFVELLTD